jgi:hypothetical protein
MHPMMPASITEESRRKTRANLIAHLSTHPEEIVAILGRQGTREDIVMIVDDTMRDRLEAKVFLNDVYQCSVEDHSVPGFPEMWHLSIKRLDREACKDWRDFQQIKNEVIGPDHEAVELYPAESRVVDVANQYHLFVLKDPGLRFPFGFQTGLKSDDAMAGTKQRKRL